MKGVLFQSGAVVILSIPNFLAAIGITWTSYTEKILKSPESPLGVALTQNQMGLVASIPMLGSLLAIATWLVPDVVGRKNTERLAGILVTLSWSLIATASSFTQLLIARLVLGIGIGVHMMIFVIYINEFSQISIRGAMACIPIFFFSFGTLISYIVGWFCSYRFIVYMNLVMCLVFTFSVNFLKESPVYLVTKRKDEEALKALKFYRGTSTTTPAIIEELEYLKRQRETTSYNLTAQDEEANPNEENASGEKTKEKALTEMSPWRILVSSKAVQRAILTVSSFCSLSMLMGLLAVKTYAGQFFRVAAPGISPDLCSVVMAVAVAAGNGLAVVLTDLVPRRVLMISSCSACGVCLFALWTILRWSWAPSWSVPLLMLLYPCSFVVGAGNLPMVQLSECFMPKMKTLASAIFMCTTFISNFLLLFLFGPAVELFGLDGVFLVFFLITLAVTVLSYFIMKETKGVPIEEIQGMYERGFLYWK